MKNRNQQGFTLIEVLLVLAIIAALGVAAFIIYPRVQAGRQATNNTSILNSAAAQINSVFPSARYDNLNTLVACNADVFPDTFKLADPCVADNLANEWGHGVAANIDIFGSTLAGVDTAGANARYYTISYANVPAKVCNKLAPALAANFGRVQVGAEVIYDIYAAPVDKVDPIDEASMTTACAADNVTILMTGK